MPVCPKSLRNAEFAKSGICKDLLYRLVKIANAIMLVLLCAAARFPCKYVTCKLLSKVSGRTDMLLWSAGLK